jgi:hypothetical protein
MNPRLLTDLSLIVAAVFYGVLLALAWAAGPFFGVWLGAILLLSLWRYCYAVLRFVAQGRREIPAPELETLNPVGEFGLVFHFIAFPASLIVFGTVQPFGATGIGLVLNWACGLAIAVIFPASAAMMALTSSLEAAFTPANIARVMTTFGRSYFALAAACVGLWIATGLVQFLLPQMGGLTRAIGNSVAVWALLATFALIGSLLRTHRNDFAIPGEIEPEEDRRARLLREDWRKTLDLAYASIRSGLAAEGYEALRRLSAQHGDSLEIGYWLFENMLEWETRAHALQIAVRLVERHVADGELYLALELFTRCRRLDPAFAVTPAAAAALAAFARSIGRHGLADEIAVAAGG